MLAREVKPWPGLVDVEPMPGEDRRRRRAGRPWRPRDDGHRPPAPGRAARGSTSIPPMFRQLADAQVNVELDTGDMVLNIGPQHPATHGTLRLVVRLDGERVIAADPVIGYMHRGYEKLTEFRTYPQITTLINRIDWLSSFANEVPFIAGAEMLMGIEAPQRGALHPHHAHRAVAHRDLLVVPRRDGPAGRRDHARVLRVPRPRVRPQSHRGGHRRALPPELQPHRRHQGRSAVGLDRASAAPRCARCSSRATSSRTSSSATRSSRSARARSGSSRPSSAPPTACRARTCARSGVDWDLRRDGKPYLVVQRARLEGVDTPRRRFVRALLGAAAGDA